jgi:hypothetical protein
MCLYFIIFYRLIGCEQVIADIPMRNCDTNVLSTPLNKSRSRDKLANMALRYVVLLEGLRVKGVGVLEKCF